MVNLRALGYTTTTEGKSYFLEIHMNMNNRRHSTNLKKTKKAYLNKIQDFLNNTPPVFDLNSGLTFKQHSIARTLNKYIADKAVVSVNVYKEGKLVEGSPFPSFSHAALVVLGSKVHRSIISKYINTNKLYKKKFRFESAN